MSYLDNDDGSGGDNNNSGNGSPNVELRMNICSR
jgi:hypothetical protein